MNRYSRHIILSEIGPEGQKKLSSARVMVVGAGGLGCPALQYLVAAGVGSIGIIDHDLVEESNLQRQVLFGTSSLGKNKAEAAKKRLEDLNPTIHIRSFPTQLNALNALEILSNYDIILDGTDNFETRYLINDAAILLNKPVVFGAIYKFEGQVSVFNYREGPSYRCMFAFPPKASSVANCSDVGVLGVLPGIIGSMQANEVIKMILEFDGVLSGKLLCYDARSATTNFITISRRQDEINKVLSQRDNFVEIHSTPEVSCHIAEISVDEVLKMKDVQFIDIREPGELPVVELPNCIKIPLGSLEENISEINSEKNIVTFCRSGIRSKNAVTLLLANNITSCYSLKGGALALEPAIKSLIK
ncbi:MAG: dinucleotide-utilizing protein [Flavobacterium sp.]|nr:MAG: dinucleotide-utilizing protein [Flavobacterium sp.]